MSVQLSVQSIARTTTRLAMILLFILALAGCGDSGDDMDAHMDEHDHDEHVHDDDDDDDHDHEGEFPGRLMVLDDENHTVYVLDLETERDLVAGTFEIERTTATRPETTQFAGTLLRGTSNGRYGFVAQYTWPDAIPFQDDHQIVVIDSGLTAVSHGDHSDPDWGTPRRMPYVIGGGETGLYNGIHIVSDHGLTAFFYDGSRSLDGSMIDATGHAVVYRYSDFDSQTTPEPIFDLDVETFIHGVAVAFHDDLFIVSSVDDSVEPDASTPNGVATYRVDAEDVEDDIVQDFRDRCPGLHGEAVTGDYVAFGCTVRTEDSGVLVLAYDEDHDSFDAHVVVYPDDDTELSSGTLVGGKGKEHSEGTFMASYGGHFLKITASEVMDGTRAGSELFMVEAGNEGHRGYAFEPVDHNFGGEGRFVVLTQTGNLYIFDVTMPAGSELAGQIMGIVDAECPVVGRCPNLALAPGFAYVSDPANNRVREVHLEHAEVERDLPMNAPTQMVVLGWFELDEELVFH